MIHVTVTNEVDKLTQEEWRFFLRDSNKPYLVLDYYAYCTRESTRHKFKEQKSYDRIRRSKYEDVSEIPLPDWVKKAAIDKLAASIEVVI